MKKPSLDELWASVPSDDLGTFNEGSLAGVDGLAKRYLEHAIEPGTKLAKAVRLTMHGEIKLSAWLPFRAEQVIRLDRGMLWQASLKMMGLPTSGYDLFLDGEGEMRWKYIGFIPIVRASGPDISRSSLGRLRAECCWLPSAFCAAGVTWSESDANTVVAELPLFGESDPVTFKLRENGMLQDLLMKRWGKNPEGEFEEMDFGGVVEEEGTFGGYTIPTKLRIGWHYGSETFEKSGEFIRVQIDSAVFK